MIDPLYNRGVSLQVSPTSESPSRDKDRSRSSLRAPLVDRFGRKHTYLRISVTDRCNFRCVYCMPPEGLLWREHAEILTYEEIERLTMLFAQMGVRKVRLTGGEPTVRKDIEVLMERLKKIEGCDTLLMTTNGFRLKNNARKYRAAGLDGLNISLDSLKRGRFKEITRQDSLEQVLAGIDAAIEEGFPSIKINFVAMAGVNEDELADFVEFTRTRPVEVRFIEFMPFHQNGWTAGGVLSFAEMKRRLGERYELIPVDAEPTAVAKEFRVEGHVGTLGFITSMTENFCSGCNRLRLTADGNMKNCLFSTTETDLRDQLRRGASDDELEATIRTCLDAKWKEHPPMERLVELHNRSMIQIGG